MERLTPKLINYASILDDNTRAQAEMTSRMPFMAQFAIMPDAHLGKGCNVGAVLATEDAIIPAAVGVDIGCGMMAIRTQWTEEEFRDFGPLRSLREDIERRIPVSAGGYNRFVYGPNTTDRIIKLTTAAHQIDGFNPYQVSPNWDMQLGTLGSGNHFIEVSVDEEDRVWLFLHSGSRGIGNRIAQRHIKIAQDLCAKWHIPLESRDLAYLVAGTPEFDQYICELKWAQEFAYRNREEMMDRVLDAVREFTWSDVLRFEEINCHHNYTSREHHYGRDVWLSRKGAIDAHEGVMGLIPGSMGTRSYVVRGLGNPAAMCSAPHGAGRTYSRSAARLAFTETDLIQAMEGIEYRPTDAFIDEIPAAYKDIDVVMEDARTLVETVHVLRQIINVKGD
jgi:tRNA-splicing ligase RtcB